MKVYFPQDASNENRRNITIIVIDEDVRDEGQLKHYLFNQQ